jgi:hypothetical protein
VHYARKKALRFQVLLLPLPLQVLLHRLPLLLLQKLLLQKLLLVEKNKVILLLYKPRISTGVFYYPLYFRYLRKS